MPESITPTWEAVQELTLSLLGIDYVLGAEIKNPGKLGIPEALWDARPEALDCSELLQLVSASAGVPQIGDGAAWQWAKCTEKHKRRNLPDAGAITVLFNNPARFNGVGHIGLGSGRTPNGVRWITEARGRAWGVVNTPIKDFLARYPSAYGVYQPLLNHLSGSKPVRIYAWYKAPRPKSVSAVQTLLRTHGFKADNGSLIDVDGDFGAKTRQAVRAFQRATGRPESGAVTVPTLKALQGYVNTL